METHRLTNVDLAAKTAICSVCGFTDIRVRQYNGKTRRSCATKHRAQLREYARRKSAIFRANNPPSTRLRSPHVLSNVDPGTRTAVCEICGQVEITLVGASWMCKIRHREYARQYARRQREQLKQEYPSQARSYGSLSHALSEVDDDKKTAVCSICGPVKIYVFHHENYTTRRCGKANSQNVMTAAKNRRDANRVFIDQYKVQVGCQRCGYNASAVGLDLHHRSPAEKDMSIADAGKYSRERLMQELEKCDVLCAICHRLVHDELGYVYE